MKKSKIIEIINDRITELECEYGFVGGNGWAQVDGKGEKINRAYGEYDSLGWLIIEINS